MEVHRIDRGDAVARRQHTVERRGGAPALDVAEQHHPRLEAGALLDRVGDGLRNAAETDVAELVVHLVATDHRTLRRLRPLGHDDDRGIATSLVAGAELRAHLVDVERVLGHEDRRCAARDARMGGDPSAVAPHHLHDHHAIVALGRGVEPVDRVRGDLHGGVETECHVGADDVVVDGLRHTDDRQRKFGVQLVRDGERAVPADHDERVEAHLVERGPHLRNPVRAVVRAAPTGAQQGSAAGQHAAQGADVELHRPALANTVPGIEETDQLVVVDLFALTDDRADHGVETWTIAPTCQNANTHVCRGYGRDRTSASACTRPGSIRRPSTCFDA